MNATRQIIERTNALFDVVGVGRLSSGDNLIILGLESTPDRDLDEFGRIDGKLQLYGFEKHVKPKLELLMDFIRGQGFFAELIGRYGYPLEGEVNLKVEAIRAGLGKRGKSTVVLHPKYGVRLRFMAIRTNAPLEQPADSTLIEEENPVCEGCSICIDICPTAALEPYRMPDPSLCLSNSNITPVTEDGHSIFCDICLHLCPAAEKA